MSRALAVDTRLEAIAPGCLGIVETPTIFPSPAYGIFVGEYIPREDEWTGGQVMVWPDTTSATGIWWPILTSPAPDTANYRRFKIDLGDGIYAAGQQALPTWTSAIGIGRHSTAGNTSFFWGPGAMIGGAWAITPSRLDIWRIANQMAARFGKQLPGPPPTD